MNKKKTTITKQLIQNGKPTLDGLFLPVQLTPSQIKCLTPVFEELNLALKPASAQEIAAQISLLKSFWYVADLPYEVYKMQTKLFIEILADFPKWALKTACFNWLKSEQYTPKPSDIYQKASEIIRPFLAAQQKIKLLIEHHNKPAS